MQLLHCRYKNQNRPRKVPGQNMMFTPILRRVLEQSSWLPRRLCVDHLRDGLVLVLRSWSSQQHWFTVSAS